MKVIFQIFKEVVCDEKSIVFMIATCVVFYTIDIVLSFCAKIIDKKHFSSCVGYKIKKNKKFCLYMASEEIIRCFSRLPEELELEIYNSYGHKIKNKLSLLRNCIDILGKAKNECRLGRYKDMKVTYEWLKEIKEVGGVNVRDAAKYFSEKDDKYIFKQKEILNDHDKIVYFLIDIPEKKDVDVAIAADSEKMFTFYNILNAISLLLLLIVLFNLNSIHSWIEKM